MDAGLGKVTSRGTVTLIPPTQTIAQPIETHRIDGIEIVFQLAPQTEAPAEMHLFYPQLGALNLAENATHHLRSDSEEVRTILPRRRALVDEAQVGFMHESRRL